MKFVLLSTSSKKKRKGKREIIEHFSLKIDESHYFIHVILKISESKGTKFKIVF